MPVRFVCSFRVLFLEYHPTINSTILSLICSLYPLVGDVNAANIEQLKIMNITSLPVRYTDKFYRELVEKSPKVSNRRGIDYHHAHMLPISSSHFIPS